MHLKVYWHSFFFSSSTFSISSVIPFPGLLSMNKSGQKPRDGLRKAGILVNLRGPPQRGTRLEPKQNKDNNGNDSTWVIHIIAVRLGHGGILFQWNRAFQNITQGFRICSGMAQTRYEMITIKYSKCFYLLLEASQSI